MSRQRDRVAENGYGDGTALHRSQRAKPAPNTTAIAIVVAGALIAAGLIASVLLRGTLSDGIGEDPGGTAASVSQSTSSLASPPASPPPGTSAPGTSAPGVSPPASTLPSGDPALKASLHLNVPDIPACQGNHLADFKPWEGSPLRDRLILIAQAAGVAGQTHYCTVSVGPGLNIFLSYSKFQSTEHMDEVFGEAFQDYAGLSSQPCEEVNVMPGFGRYQFQDGRAGQVLCARQPGAVVFFAWTEETTNVVSVVYGTNTNDTTMEALREFWTDDAGPVCLDEEGGTQVELSTCAAS